MKLTRKERWILSNQYKILEFIDKNNADHYKRCQEVLNCGYEFNYESLIPYINKETMSHRDCIEVLEILDMFFQLKFVNDKLPKEDKVKDGFAEFPGFDGNNETKQLLYTQFVFDIGNGFANLNKKDRFNSHARLLRYYRVMVKEWKKSSDKFYLTVDDLYRITSVKYPGKSGKYFK